MREVIHSCRGFLQRLLGSHARKGKYNSLLQGCRTPRFEPLESRELLSVTLYWAGTGTQTWDTLSTNCDWSTNSSGTDRVRFQNGADVVFDIYFASTDVKLSGDVQPASMTFKLPGYTITESDTNEYTISSGAVDHKLTATVEQTGTTEFSATISVPITGISTDLVVPASVDSDHTGKLILSGANTYQGGTDVTGGILQAVKPNSLPINTSANCYYPVTVTSTTGAIVSPGTLIVEAQKNASGTDIDWSSNDISKLLNASPTTTTFAANTNFGISVDVGTSFEYSGVIPGSSVAPLRLENFVKLDTGTLTLSGTNSYLGDTTIQQGTLIASKPEALQNYDSANKIFVKEAHVVGTKYDFNMGYGYIKDSEDVSDTTHHYNSTEDPHSTLIVRANSDGSTTGWDKENIRKLLHGSDWDDTEIAHFENNTYFGIEVDSGSYFDISTDAIFRLGSTTSVGFVKLGTGTLEFGSHTAPSFSGPASIYGGRKWGRESLVSRVLKPQKGGCPKKTEKLVLGI